MATKYLDLSVLPYKMHPEPLSFSSLSLLSFKSSFLEVEAYSTGPCSSQGLRQGLTMCSQAALEFIM